MIDLKTIFKTLLFTLFILGIISIVFYISVSLYGYNSIEKERKKLQNGSSLNLIYHNELGYRLKANNTYDWSIHSKLDKDTSIYINVDSFNRRFSPRDSANTRHALFFGCSYTFGDGLNDKETLPAFYYKNDTSFNTYNYAFGGYGIQQMYEILKKDIRN